MTSPGAGDSYREAQREHRSLTAAVEKRLLVFLAERLPASVTPDHLTLLGLLANLAGGIAYALVPRSPLWLHAVNVCLVLNWAGDSLDGTVARVRQRLRPRYGFYVDHMVDALAILFLLLGLTYSGLVTPAIAIALLLAYYFLTINMGFATQALGVFKISFGLLGGTELRILIILANLLALAKPSFAWWGREILVFDVLALGATIGVAATALRSTVQVGRRLYEMERLD
jgi:phosphatidylglycerophosphate synthase